MPRRLSYPVGAPCWVDRISGRLAEVEGFYAGLFGWTFTDDGSYRTAMLGGDVVAGFGSAGAAREFWTVYLAAEDLGATATAITGCGGTIVLAPIAIGEAGRLLLALDPVGTLVGFWSGSVSTGIVVADEAGATCRHELIVPDPRAVAEFYAAVGLQLVERDGRLHLEASGKPVIDVVVDAAAPPRLLPYFAVADLASAVRDALGRGATLAKAPAGSPVRVTDPWGARFGLQVAS